MEDSATAFDVRLDSQLKTVNRLKNENEDLKTVNKDQSEKLKLVIL